MSSKRLLKRLLGSELAGLSVAGQPTHLTHPKLIGPSQLTPGITVAEYAQRREALVNALPQNSIAIIAASAGQFMAGNIPYPYRQDASFAYLTGITQPNVVAVLGTEDSSSPGYTLFVREPSSLDATWTGTRINRRAAVEVFGADEAHDLQKMYDVLRKSARSARRIFYDLDERGPKDISVLRERLGVDVEVRPLKPYTHDLRWRKSEAELDLMRQSADVAAQGIRRCMELSSPGVSEHKLAASFEYRCKMNGASNLAYPSVVAGGSSATIIHYGDNNKAVQAGELLLMDAGCERHGYASDVTRTWPVSGRFTPEQRAVYDVVYQIYRDCLQQCRLGVSLRDIHQHSIRLVSEGIADLGLIRGRPASLISQYAYREFYPHSVGHWLGMDTHDSPLQGLDRLLQPNAVMTLEPGLYVPDHPKYGKFAGIGIRLEDDVAIREFGPEVLSSAAPLDPVEIESLVGTADVYSRVAVL